MGAKQSKRSVEIGKEAEGAGEVAGAGAGGEGRLEPLADADALKPHANGDAHAQTQDDKEKETKPTDESKAEDMEAAAEKVVEEQKPKEQEGTPATNGDGETAPAPEDAKKPKKEKVKKKWSLRSISFSRKDKPKQEKKQKDEEAKTNGEAEKVLEEAVEATAETVIAEEKPEPEIKEQKTPETPVTEPITNGSSTPDSKIESPTIDKPVTVDSGAEKSESKVILSPEQLPINGLSLEETKKEITEVITKIEETVITTINETIEPATVPETIIKTEVCDQSMPLIEPVPPPLPASLPPTSIASFAATTMAPEVTDALLDNTVNTTNSDQHIPSLSKHIEIPELSTALMDTKLDNTEHSLALKEVPEEKTAEATKITTEKQESPVVNSHIPQQMSVDSESSLSNEESKNAKLVAIKINGSVEEASEANSLMEDLPPLTNDTDANNDVTSTLNSNANHLPDDEITNDTNSEKDKLRKKIKDSLGNVITNAEFNGNIDNGELTNGVGEQTESCADVSPPSLVEANSDASDSFPPPPSDLATGTQEIHSISKKGADLLQDIPSVPDFKTDTVQEASTDVVVAN